MFRDLLAIRERIGGPEHSHTLVVRFRYAAATLQLGDAEAAQALLDPIPQMSGEPFWRDRWSAELVFTRGQVADALGRREDADGWLQQAATQYAAAYPPDHNDRRKFDAYMAAGPRLNGQRKGGVGSRQVQPGLSYRRDFGLRCC
jgi:hypothetical protein